MDLGAFFKKEWFQFRRNIGVVLVVLVLLPGAAAMGTAAFQQTIPEDVPIGIAAQDDTVAEQDMATIQAGTALYASPSRYDSRETAEKALEREDVYLVLLVPDGAFEEGADVNATMISDQRLAPFREASNYTASVLDYQLDERLPADVTVTHERVGVQHSLSEYLIPTALVLVLVLYSFVYFPFELYRERDVFERVELQSRIETAVLAKIAFHSVLLVIPLTVFQLVSLRAGYRLSHFNPHTIAVIAVTFVYLTSIAGLIMFASRLRRTGIYLNIGVMTGILALSSFVFPVGFFSSIRKTIALTLPTYHSMVMVRSTMMKGTSLALFSPRFELLVGFTVVMGVLLRSSINYYRRAK